MSRIEILINNLTRKLYHRYFVIFVFGFSAVSASLIFSAHISEKNIIEKQGRVYFLDIGQGDSTLIITSSGNRILIDAGNVDGRSVDEIRKILPWYDRRIDLAIGTHADIDHVGGFLKILQNFNVGKFLFSHIHTSKSVEKNLFNSMKNARVSTSSISRGARISFASSTDYINILYPERMMGITSDKDTNLFSVIAMVHIGNQNFLLTGDAPRSVELKLVEANKIIKNTTAENTDKYLNSDKVCPEKEDGVLGNFCSLRTDILKVGHHGSRTSTDPIFVEWTKPSYAVISDGKNNRYGHPHVETLETLKNSDVKIFRTDENGTIEF